MKNRIFCFLTVFLVSLSFCFVSAYAADPSAIIGNSSFFVSSCNELYMIDHNDGRVDAAALSALVSALWQDSSGAWFLSTNDTHDPMFLMVGNLNISIRKRTIEANQFFSKRTVYGIYVSGSIDNTSNLVGGWLCTGGGNSKLCMVYCEERDYEAVSSIRDIVSSMFSTVSNIDSNLAAYSEKLVTDLRAASGTLTLTYNYLQTTVNDMAWNIKVISDGMKVQDGVNKGLPVLPIIEKDMGLIYGKCQDIFNKLDLKSAQFDSIASILRTIDSGTTSFLNTYMNVMYANSATGSVNRLDILGQKIDALCSPSFDFDSLNDRLDGFWGLDAVGDYKAAPITPVGWTYANGVFTLDASAPSEVPSAYSSRILFAHPSNTQVSVTADSLLFLDGYENEQSFVLIGSNGVELSPVSSAHFDMTTYTVVADVVTTVYFSNGTWFFQSGSDSPVALSPPLSYRLTDVLRHHHYRWFRWFYVYSQQFQTWLGGQISSLSSGDTAPIVSALSNFQTALLAKLDAMQTGVSTSVDNTVINIDKTSDKYNVFYVEDKDGNKKSVVGLSGDLLGVGGKLLDFLYKAVFSGALGDAGGGIGDLSNFYLGNGEGSADLWGS